MNAHHAVVNEFVVCQHALDRECHRIKLLACCHMQARVAVLVAQLQPRRRHLLHQQQSQRFVSIFQRLV